MTKRNTSVSASTVRLIVTLRSPTVNHCQRICLSGVSALKPTAIAITVIADRVTVPAPMSAMRVLGRCLPNRDRMRNPISGSKGIMYR